MTGQALTGLSACLPLATMHRRTPLLLVLGRQQGMGSRLQDVRGSSSTGSSNRRVWGAPRASAVVGESQQYMSYSHLTALKKGRLCPRPRALPSASRWLLQRQQWQRLPAPQQFQGRLRLG